MTPVFIVGCAAGIILVWTLVGAWCIARMWDGWQKAEAERERAQRHREQVNRDLVAALLSLTGKEVSATVAMTLATKNDSLPAALRGPEAHRRVPVS